jgi:hypothetical protein
VEPERGTGTLTSEDVLLRADHPHHEVAHDWFAGHQMDGWATCPLTQNGFVRMLANPRVRSEINRPLELVDYLARFCASKHHVFWGLCLVDRSKDFQLLVLPRPSSTEQYLSSGPRQENGEYLGRRGRVESFARATSRPTIEHFTRKYPHFKAVSRAYRLIMSRSC